MRSGWRCWSSGCSRCCRRSYRRTGGLCATHSLLDFWTVGILVVQAARLEFLHQVWQLLWSYNGHINPIRGPARQLLGQIAQAVRGMKAGDTKTFPVLFPESYHGKEVAGKEADFLVTMKKIEGVNLPEITDEFATAMGASDGTVAGLRVDARRNLEQEVKYRILRTNKSAVMDVLGQSAVFELPKSLVEQETQRLVENARRDLQQRGVKDVDSVPLPLELLQPEGEKRVRLGLILGELVQAHQLNAKPEQLQAHIQELARSYQNPAEVVGWYLSDRQRMAEVESMVLESNVTDFVLSKAEVTEKVISFDELMSI